MYLPSVERFQCDGKRPVRYPVVKQTSHDAGPSIGIALREAERIWRMVIIEGYFIGIVGILLPAFQPFQTILERGVTDGLGIALYILEMFFIQDFHDSCILSVKHVRLREPVFLFLACQTVPCLYPARFGERKYRSRGEDDFLSANPAGADLAGYTGHGTTFAGWEIKYIASCIVPHLLESRRFRT